MKLAFETTLVLKYGPCKVHTHPKEPSPPPPICTLAFRARIFKHLRSQGIDSKELIPPAYVAWRAGYDNAIPTRFLPSPHRLFNPGKNGPLGAPM